MIILTLAALLISASESSSRDRIRLRDVEVLTLKDGAYTSGRRVTPIPQLKCVGGTAGCTYFRPHVVQCYNRGTDGSDVHWECKTNMDPRFQFGTIEVICEGYNYPDDEFILKGSCGLEYSIDWAYNGQQKRWWSLPNIFNFNSSKSLCIFGFKLTDILFFGCVCIFIYAFYNMIAGQSYNDSSGPGFRPEYYPSSGCDGGSSSRPGFWTGLGAGSLLGICLAAGIHITLLVLDILIFEVLLHRRGLKISHPLLLDIVENLHLDMVLPVDDKKKL
ncbi:Store-operated calcium entry-associated regulatory factor [Trichinella spiralis]|uniref:Store-operated calcium entry-associated regulatory factor n=1 Tax=Trichinella spiralis TaxID=6334 RepID=A0ABR3KEH6_TRISP